MNNIINSILNKIPPVVQAGIVVVLALSLAVFVWYKGAQVWNGIGNFLFHRQINAERAKVSAELEAAAGQKKVLEQTLRDLAEAKKDLESVKAEKDRLEKIFNDQSKTAAEKVAEFKKALADDPVHTPTDNITTEDLCTRAKAIGSSAATIAALCGQ